MFAIPVILGLCITCLGNFETEAKDQVKPFYGNHTFDQHSYPENIYKRQSDVNQTYQHINDSQSSPITNDDQRVQPINDGQSDQIINNNKSGMHINDDQFSQNINNDQRGPPINGDLSTQNKTAHHSQVNESQSRQNTNDNQNGKHINDDRSSQNLNDQRNQQINDNQSEKIKNDDQHDQHTITVDLSGQNITDNRSQINESQSEQNTNDEQSGQNSNDDQRSQNTISTLAHNTSGDLDDNASDEDAYLPDEHFLGAQDTISYKDQQAFWNYYPNKEYNTSNNENSTGPHAAYGGLRVSIEIPELNLRSTALSNKGGHSLQWHVGIYTKTSTPYMQICGGTLVTLNTVISAAHCFWGDAGAFPADLFAVGAGKLYRPWFEAHETHSQTSDVSAFHIPPRYRGSLTNFQDDIAVVQLTLTLTTSPAVVPACVSFDETLDEEQLTNGTSGTVMGWGLTQADGDPSQVLNYVELPSVPVDKCFEQAGPDFVQYITSDKICAGVTGQALCKGDSGGGLVFIYDSVPYLRGVASTAPRNGHACNTAAIATFAHVFHHRAFLLKHVPRLERDCQRRYKAAIVEDKSACRRTTQSLYSPYEGTTTYCDCYTT